MLIRNYGLFWRRTSIYWGAGRNAGHLKGVLSTARTARPVDFRLQQGVYVLYDDGFNLVYVGQAGRGNSRLFRRLKAHRTDSLAERWTRLSWFGVRKVNLNGTLKSEKLSAKISLNDVLNHIEAILIASEEPPHNLQSGRFGENVQQYLQHHDKIKLRPPLEQMVGELWDKIDDEEDD